MTNKQKAEQYFIEKGLMPKKEDRTEKWILHHIDPAWKREDPERYEQWNPEDLVPMRNKDHTSLHHKNKIVPPEVVKHISETQKGKVLTEEHKQHISESMIAKGTAKGENNGFYGKGYLRVGGLNPAARPVICIETGNIFGTITEAIKWSRLSRNKVYKSLHTGKQINGLTFQFLERGN